MFTFLKNYIDFSISYNNLTEKMLNFSAFHKVKSKELDNFFCQIVAGNKKSIKKFFKMKIN